MVDVEKLRDTIPTPIWASWKNKRTVTLNQALLLCMNVCPRWYEARDDKDKFLSNITIWSLYRLYLEDAHDWASGSGWVIEYLAEADIQEDDFVDLKKFARWACQDVEWNGIPAEFKAIAKVTGVALIEGTSNPAKHTKLADNLTVWKSKAKEVGEKYLDDYGIKGSGVDKTLGDICNYVAKELGNLGYTNSRGNPLIGETIRSECLGGEWYQAMIIKGKILPK